LETIFVLHYIQSSVMNSETSTHVRW